MDTTCSDSETFQEARVVDSLGVKEKVYQCIKSNSIEKSERRRRSSQGTKRIADVRMIKEGVSGKRWRSEIRLTANIYLLTLTCSSLR